MRRFITQTVLFFLPILVLIGGVNYLGDPARIFDSTYERSLVQILNGGRHVTDVADYDERLFQKYFAQSLESAPEILVMGSSRAMMLRSEHVGLTSDMTRSFVNSSVSGASVEDLVAIYQMYKSLDRLPSQIVLGVDPWIFNAHHGQERWRSLEAEYQAFVAPSVEAVGWKGSAHQLGQLASASYFQAALPHLWREWRHPREPRATPDMHNDTMTRLMDGALVYGDEVRLATPSDVEAKARSYVQGTVYSLGQFRELSAQTMQLLRLLIEDMQRMGVEVLLLLSPYHPLVYAELDQSYPQVVAAERWVGGLAEDLGLAVLGSYDPSRMGADASDFYDGMHCRGQIFSTLLLEAIDGE